ncbi:sigma-70 family RNA polymerase sigma factor [Salinimonas marina]|uniref:Sigma-70 family RNA polymerase sigma factor n=1 Tax=Salinimonas marina TaxID=2785918 RepID=A0A7S9DYH7_9ALTE|nr:sigma-70 family RNA polymerase sigma factor [Salinimonas marina]QPG05635.1 sigma-70 family RNA polymerase sigma factor [Salinimonas marina]
MSNTFEQIAKEYGPILTRVASSYEADPTLCEELTQEIVLAVWQSLARFAGNSSLKTYILKVAHNRAVTHVSKAVRCPLTEPISEQYCPGAAASQPEQQLEQTQQRQRLLVAVRALPIQSRQVLTLSLEGLGYTDIAQICGLTTSNVGVILNRAKAALQQELTS